MAVQNECHMRPAAPGAGPSLSAAAPAAPLPPAPVPWHVRAPPPPPAPARQDAAGSMHACVEASRHRGMDALKGHALSRKCTLLPSACHNAECHPRTTLLDACNNRPARLSRPPSSYARSRPQQCWACFSPPCMQPLQCPLTCWAMVSRASATMAATSGGIPPRSKPSSEPAPAQATAQCECVHTAARSAPQPILTRGPLRGAPRGGRRLG